MSDNQDFFILRWARFFVTRYRISMLIIAAIIIAGSWGVITNQRQDFPEVPINIVFVGATYPGAAPGDVEQEIIIPIEQTARAYNEVDYVQSRAQNSFGGVEIFLKDVGDLAAVSTRLDNDITKLNLPQAAEINIQTVDAAGPAIAFGLVGENGVTVNDLLQYAGTVQSRLEKAADGIKEIEISPANEFEIQITLDGEAVAQNSLSYDQIKNTIQSQLASLPGGTVRTNTGQQKSITILAPIGTLDDFKSIQIGPVTLGTIATIERVPTDSEQIHYVGYRAKTNEPRAREAVYLLIYKTPDGDIINISDALTAETEAIESSDLLPDNMHIVVGYTLAPYIEDQISSLLNNGFIGLAIILVVLLFFINFRAAIVVTLAIPIVFLIGLFAIKVAGFSLNILTLFAMILTLGILVDNAIVIAEGMTHELERGATRRQAALRAIKKYGPAITAATATTIVVFIPFASLGGIMGDFLKYIPYTIMIIIAASFFVALSIIPLAGRWIMKQQTYQQRKQSGLPNWQKLLIIPLIVRMGQDGIDAIGQRYQQMMSRLLGSLRLKLLVMSVVTILLAVSFVYFAPQLAFEQMPTKDSANLQVSVDFPAGMPSAEKKEVFQIAQDELIALPYFESFYTFESTIYATFTEPRDRTEETTIFDIQKIYENKLANVRNQFSDEVVITPRAVSYGPPQDQYAIVVNFLGNNKQNLVNAADDLEQFLQNKEGVSEIKNGPREALVPAVTVNLQQDELARATVNPLVAAGMVNAIFAEETVGSIVLGDREISDDVTVTFDQATTDSVNDLRQLTIPTLNQGLTTLDQIALIEEVEEPVTTRRLRGQRVATVSVALAEGAHSEPLTTEIKNYLTPDKLVSLGLNKDGVKYGGEFAALDSDYEDLQIVFLLAILAVYLILVYQFYSYMQPALILFAVPLSLIGVFPGLLLVNSSLNMVSGLGIIALVGIVVNDAIVMITTFNRYRAEHPDESFNSILVRTGHNRFKPIFSTSITTIGGILPLTIADPFWTGLGTSIVAGLIFSTVGTLIAIPTLYSVACSAWSKIRRRRVCDTIPADRAQ